MAIARVNVKIAKRSNNVKLCTDVKRSSDVIYASKLQKQPKTKKDLFHAYGIDLTI